MTLASQVPLSLSQFHRILSFFTMADNTIDSDSLIGSKRRTTSETEQQEEALLQLPSETTADHRDSNHQQHPQEETAISPNKKANCSPLLSEENQETCLHSFTQKNVKEGSFGVQEVDTQQRVIKVEAFESGNVLEVEKKRLLAELEVGNIFGLSKIDNEKKELVLPVKGSLKFEVIDDIALIGSFPLSRTGKDDKTKRSRRKGKILKKGLGESGTGNKTESNIGNKIMYSRKELEALRFAKVVEQRNFWKDVYNSLGKDVIRQYEDLGSCKHQKNIGSGSRSSSDMRHPFGRKGESPANMGEGYSENGGNGTENVYPFDFTPTHDVEVDAFVNVEEECIEDDDSDEDYTTILRPAFMVKGEPDFDSGPPEDGLEYLRRVRWEAAQIPKVKIAKPDRIISNKEQSVYMPQIPEIAKCPEHLLPLKQWEDAFLADFSELRLTLSHMEDPSSEISCKLPTLSVQEDLCQFSESAVIEKFNNHATGEVPLLNTADGEISLSNNNPCPKTSISDSCGDYPTLSAIRKMDSVARVSMLRKRISSVENMSSLSKSNCAWLYALCAAIDTPLDADTCASLRCLLRKCADLRAGKSEVDDEVIMLNILATISGRYFGQSET